MITSLTRFTWRTTLHFCVKDNYCFESAFEEEQEVMIIKRWNQEVMKSKRWWWWRGEIKRWLRARGDDDEEVRSRGDEEQEVMMMKRWDQEVMKSKRCDNIWGREVREGTVLAERGDDVKHVLPGEQELFVNRKVGGSCKVFWCNVCLDGKFCECAQLSRFECFSRVVVFSCNSLFSRDVTKILKSNREAYRTFTFF